MHPFRKLEKVPNDSAQALWFSMKRCDAHSGSDKPIVGRALVSIAISIGTEPRRSGKYIFEGRSTLATTFSDGKAPPRAQISRAWSA